MKTLNDRWAGAGSTMLRSLTLLILFNFILKILNV